MERVNGKKVEDFYDISLEDGIRAESGKDIKIYSDADKTAELQDTVWDDQQVVLGSVKLGASAPTWTAYKGGEVLAFSKLQDNKISFTMQMSHKLKQSTNIEFHIHDTVPDDTAGVVRWIFTYSFIDIGGDFPGESTATIEQTIVVNSADKHILFELAANIGQSSSVSGIAIMSLTREGTHANDTYDNDLYLVALDAHFEMDTVGSRQETVK